LPGEAAMITVNGKEVDIHAKITNGDKVVVTPSTAGEAAKQLLEKVPELNERFRIIVNGNEVTLERTALVNGERQLSSYMIKDGDVIEITNWYTVEQIAELADVVLDNTVKIMVNDVAAKADTKVYNEFSVTFEKVEVPQTENDWSEDATEEADIQENMAEDSWAALEAEADAAAENRNEQDFGAQENAAGEQGTVENAGTVSGASVDMVVIVNKQPVVLRGKKEYVFVDVFDYINFDLSKSGGKSIVTEINGRPAQYMEALTEGDVIDIYWRN